MGVNASDLFHQALALSPDARAALADSLLESLDPHVDPNAEELWQTEVRKRAAEIDSGSVQATPWPDVRTRLNRFLQTLECQTLE